MKIKISLVINIIIVILTITAAIIMFTGFKFMEGDLLLESTNIGMLRFFTVDSNIFMAIVSLLFAIKEARIIKGKDNEISTKMYILKLMSTMGVMLTFLTVMLYLGPIAKGGIPVLLKNSNLFFHLIIPILSLITFTIFEKTNKLEFKYTIYGVVPTLIYGIYYLINVLVHIENGSVSPIYDWYWFVQGGLWQIGIVIPIMIGISYAISLVLWAMNRKK